jgi:hypothetical protein
VVTLVKLSYPDRDFRRYYTNFEGMYVVNQNRKIGKLMLVNRHLKLSLIRSEDHGGVEVPNKEGIKVLNTLNHIMATVRKNFKWTQIDFDLYEMFKQTTCSGFKVRDVFVKVN